MSLPTRASLSFVFVSLLPLVAACTDPNLPLIEEAPPAGDEADLGEMAQPVTFSDEIPIGYYNNVPLPPLTVYLTFDDGPGEWTNGFLDVLAGQSLSQPSAVPSPPVRATFFVNAFNLKTNGLVGYEDVIARIVSEGHALGNHTRSHPNLAALSAHDVAKEIDENQRLVNVALKARGMNPYPLTLFRPPFGAPWFGYASRPDLRQKVGSLVGKRALNVLWNVGSGDSNEWCNGEWFNSTGAVTASGKKYFYDPKHPDYVAKVARIRDTVLKEARGQGIVVLLHDTHPTSRDALRDIIDGLFAKGYHFRTVEDLSNDVFAQPSLSAAPACDTTMANGGEPVCGRIRHFYETNGGVKLFGNTLERADWEFDTRTMKYFWTQWFENGRVEVHPEALAPRDVALARLGEQRLLQKGIDWKKAAPSWVPVALRDALAPEAGPKTGCRWFARTKHNVCNEGAVAGVGMLSFWRNNGIIASSKYVGSQLRFGNPISAAYTETVSTPQGPRVRTVQWFERARLEWHGYEALDVNKVRIAPLGREVLENRDL
nr:hypothetical protein [uncultured bacterium]